MKLEDQNPKTIKCSNSENQDILLLAGPHSNSAKLGKEGKEENEERWKRR